MKEVTVYRKTEKGDLRAEGCVLSEAMIKDSSSTSTSDSSD